MHGKHQPERATVAAFDRLHVVEHPLMLTLLGRVRDQRTDAAEFGALAALIASRLLWEACADAVLVETDAPNFAGRPTTVHEIGEHIAAVAVLRAGLLFAAPFRGLLPSAPLYQIGIKRDERTLEAVSYGDNLPPSPGWADRVLLLDPMLATGNSAIAALSGIRRSHTGRVDLVALIAAPIGVEAVLNAEPETRIFTAALDERLNDQGYIEPGLGDAGDRLFGTPPDA